MLAYSGSLLRALAALAVGLWLAAPAAATHIVLADFSITIGPADDPTTVGVSMLEAQSTRVEENDDGSISFFEGSMSTDMWLWSWDELRIKEDPIISAAQSFTNLSTSANDFLFGVSLGTGAVGPTSLIGGSSSVSVADADNSGSATLQNSTGQPGYAGLLDGATQLTLLDPFSLTALSGGTSATSETLGLSGSGPTIGAPAVASDIGLTHRFNLTGRDTATFNSTFVVEPIPEPGTLLLVGLGCAGLAGASRSRRA